MTASGPADRSSRAIYKTKSYVHQMEDLWKHTYTPRVSYKGTETYEYAEHAWSKTSHSGLFIK